MPKNKKKEPAVPEGRRHTVRNEVAFHILPTMACRPHRYLDFDVGSGVTVAVCGVCGKIRPGELMPADLQPKLPQQ